MKTQILKKTLLASCITIAATSQIQASSTNRIIGGIESSAGNYSWITSLQSSDGQHFCGASLIAKQWVMTAAHCVEDESTGVVVAANTMQVVVGDYNTAKADVGEQKRKITQVIVHPNRNASAGNDHDIALLKLSSEVSNVAVTPISPELMKTIKTGTALTVMGWGNLSTTGQDFPDKLNEVQVPLVSNTECSNNYGSGITENMVCAGYAQGGKDSCQGDSGGPLLYQVDDQWHQVGIVSFGNGCAQAGSPGVYARVEKYGEWIASQIKVTGTGTDGGTDTGTGTDGGTDTGTGTDGGTDTGTGTGSGTDTDDGFFGQGSHEAALMFNLPDVIDIFSYDGQAEILSLPLENMTNAAIHISGIRIEDNAFSLGTSSCNMTLDPQQQCEVSIRYTPSSDNAFVSTKMIIDLVDGSNVAVTLQGENLSVWGDDFDSGFNNNDWGNTENWDAEFADTENWDTEFADDDMTWDDNTETDDIAWGDDLFEDLFKGKRLAKSSTLKWYRDGSAWQKTATGFELDNSALYNTFDKSILEAKVSGAGELSFEFEFTNDVEQNSVTYYVDGKAVRTVKGSQNGQVKHSTQLSAGEHRLTWTYSKKSAASGQFKLQNIQFKANTDSPSTPKPINTDNTSSDNATYDVSQNDAEKQWNWSIRNFLSL